MSRRTGRSWAGRIALGVALAGALGLAWLMAAPVTHTVTWTEVDLDDPTYPAPTHAAVVECGSLLAPESDAGIDSPWETGNDQFSRIAAHTPLHTITVVPDGGERRRIERRTSVTRADVCDSPRTTRAAMALGVGALAAAALLWDGSAPRARRPRGTGEPAPLPARRSLLARLAVVSAITCVPVLAWAVLWPIEPAWRGEYYAVGSDGDCAPRPECRTNAPYTVSIACGTLLAPIADPVATPSDFSSDAHVHECDDARRTHRAIAAGAALIGTVSVLADASLSRRRRAPTDTVTA